jgi:general secretion pathway protein G
MRREERRKESGFTLIELLVVLAILAILAAAILPNVVGKKEGAMRTKAQTDIAMIESLLDQYYLDMDRYPTSEEGLRVLYFKPNEETTKWKGPYSKKPIPNDPWGNPYIYESPGAHSAQPYEVMSYGRDGGEGGEGEDADVVSWVEIEGEGY